LNFIKPEFHDLVSDCELLNLDRALPVVQRSLCRIVADIEHGISFSQYPATTETGIVDMFLNHWPFSGTTDAGVPDYSNPLRYDYSLCRPSKCLNQINNMYGFVVLL
jgi:hypothetical protein